MHRPPLIQDTKHFAVNRPDLFTKPHLSALNIDAMLLWLMFLALFLLCAGFSTVFNVYICALWYATLREAAATSSGKGASKGMSASELEMLPPPDAGTAVVGMECAVCLEDIETGQLARVLPLCRHAFHRPYADAWLSSNAVCPLCRTPPMLTPPPLPDEIV